MRYNQLKIKGIMTGKEIIKADKQTKRDKLIQALFMTKTKKDAGLMAGYTENSAGAIVSKYLADPKFQDDLKRYAITKDINSLAIVSQIEDKALKEVLKTEDTDEFLDRRNKIKDITKQKKQISGILANEDDKKPVTINIKEIGSIMLNNLRQDNSIENKQDNIIDCEYKEVE